MANSEKDPTQKRPTRLFKVIAIIASIFGMLMSSATEGVVQGLVESGIKNLITNDDLRR